MTDAVLVVPKPFTGEYYKYIVTTKNTHQNINGIMIANEEAEAFNNFLARLIATIPPSERRRFGKNAIAEHETVNMLWHRVQETEPFIDAVRAILEESEIPKQRPQGFTGPIETPEEVRRRQLDLKWKRMHSLKYICEQRWTREILEALHMYDTDGGFGTAEEQLHGVKALSPGEIFDLMSSFVADNRLPIGSMPYGRQSEPLPKKEAIPVIARACQLMRTARTDDNKPHCFVSYTWSEQRGFCYGALTKRGLAALVSIKAKYRGVNKPEDDTSDHWEHVQAFNDAEDEH